MYCSIACLYFLPVRSGVNCYTLLSPNQTGVYIGAGDRATHQVTDSTVGDHHVGLDWPPTSHCSLHPMLGVRAVHLAGQIPLSSLCHLSVIFESYSLEHVTLTGALCWIIWDKIFFVKVLLKKMTWSKVINPLTPKLFWLKEKQNKNVTFCIYILRKFWENTKYVSKKYSWIF